MSEPSTFLYKQNLLFRILSLEPNLNASQLQTRAREAGVSLTRVGAYRALKLFRDSGGQLEQTQNRYFRTIAEVIRSQSNACLTAVQIRQLALPREQTLHQATVYRVLARLAAMGLVLVSEKGRQKYYQWKRNERNAGKIVCTNCGRAIDARTTDLDEAGKQISTRLGYEYVSIEFYLKCVCRDCLPYDRTVTDCDVSE